MIKIELSEQELQALVGLLDAGLKTIGLRGAKEAAALVDKLEAAAQVAQSNVVPIESTDEPEADAA